MTDFTLNRRDALAFVALASGGLAACNSAGAEAGSQAASGSNATTGVCMLTPEVTEGPYYLDPTLERADIRDNHEGVPLQLVMTVVEGSTCKPVSGARVDVWHADAQGNYSGFGQPGETLSAEAAKQRFLRGHQPTDANGVAKFTTIWPGWYQGRTTHIHFKVWLEDDTVLTGQLFLPDALSEFLYTQAPDYKRSQTRDTLNETDGIAKQATRASFAAVKEEEDRYVASLTIGIDRSARSTESQPGGPGGEAPAGAPGGRPPGPPPGGQAGPPGEQGRTQLLTGEERLKAILPGD